MFARFRIDEPLGKGGMAIVYKAYELHLERHVALKVLPAALLHEETFSQRFEREARIVAQLEHPHIVPIYNFGIDEGVPWMSMRLLSGGTLAEELRGRRFTPAEVASVLEPVAAALDHAHAHGVVHRDVKPNNVMRDAFGHHYLTDFGIARMSAAATQLTTTGVMTGTPFYMSPEQALAATVDGRSDIYSLGIVAYEMLTGAVPFTGDTPMAVMMKHTRDPLPAADPSVLPRDVFAALSKCLAKEPADRFPTASAFVQALQRTGAPHAIPATGAALRLDANEARSEQDDGTAQTRAVRMSMSGSATIERHAEPVSQKRDGGSGRKRWTFAISFTISICALFAVGLLTLRQRPSTAPAATVARNEPPVVAPPAATVAPAANPPAAPERGTREGRPRPPAPPAAATAPPAASPPAAAPPPGVAPAPALAPAPAITVPPPMNLRYDGSYRIGPTQAGRYIHWVFRPDNTCAIVVLPLQALPRRAVPEAPGSSCSYIRMPRRATIALTRPDGTTERAMLVLSADDSITIRQQSAQFVPFLNR